MNGILLPPRARDLHREPGGPDGHRRDRRRGTRDRLRARLPHLARVRRGVVHADCTAGGVVAQVHRVRQPDADVRPRDPRHRSHRGGDPRRPLPAPSRRAGPTGAPGPRSHPDPRHRGPSGARRHHGADRAASRDRVRALPGVHGHHRRGGRPRGQVRRCRRPAHHPPRAEAGLDPRLGPRGRQRSGGLPGGAGDRERSALWRPEVGEPVLLRSTHHLVAARRRRPAVPGTGDRTARGARPWCPRRRPLVAGPGSFSRSPGLKGYWVTRSTSPECRRRWSRSTSSVPAWCGSPSCSSPRRCAPAGRLRPAHPQARRPSRRTDRPRPAGTAAPGT